ncbi:hypothetical protein CAEBREN_07825 [Caenorhabditis brenneri]|uniref:Uncharacterized protein n=1 Tax=Caenorhabditis brenneri TaxID=135651 RepID=G0NKB9_CAEBE|nr:hypothetical protein CAEBREN_07825 [Caenorhabditis brenneri]
MNSPVITVRISMKTTSRFPQIEIGDEIFFVCCVLL